MWLNLYGCQAVRCVFCLVVACPRMLMTLSYVPKRIIESLFVSVQTNQTNKHAQQNAFMLILSLILVRRLNLVFLQLFTVYACMYCECRVGNNLQHLLTMYFFRESQMVTQLKNQSEKCHRISLKEIDIKVAILLDSYFLGRYI